MVTKLIPIGNSMGLLIPGSFIKQLNLDKTELEILIENKGLVIRPVTKIPPRKEWDKLFKAAIAADGNPEKDQFEGMENESDENEWTW